MRKNIMLLLCLVIIVVLFQSAYALDMDWVKTDLHTIDGEEIYERVIMTEEDISNVVYYTSDGTEVGIFYEYDVHGKEIASYKRVDRALPTYSVQMMTAQPFACEQIATNVSGTKITVPECPFRIQEGLQFKCWRLDPIEDGELVFLKPGDTLVVPNQNVVLVAILKTKDNNGGENDNKPVIIPSLPAVSSNPYTSPYTDISNHWANDIIQYIDKLGLIDRATATTFAPDKPMTREVFVTAMARLAGVESDYINWAIEIGLLKGYGDGEYGLNDTITREQMAVFFLRFLELTDVDYEACKTVAPYKFTDDAKIADWAKDAVYEMQALDLIHGKGNGIFDPKGLTTRAEGATVLYNMCKTVLKK